MRAKDFIVERDSLMGQPDPVIVISDSNGKQLDRLAMSVAAKKYGFNIAQIRPQFKHQDKVKHKQYTLSAPVSGQPVEEEVEVDESGIMYRAGVKKYGKKGFEELQKAGRDGASEEEKGAIKDKHLKKKK